jgi:hypothetical protein
MRLVKTGRGGAALTVLPGAVLMLGLAGCFREPPERYAAEVGYYDQMRAVQWEVFGDFGSFEACREQAQARYDSYRTRDAAFSWACLLKAENGGYAARYR